MERKGGFWQAPPEIATLSAYSKADPGAIRLAALSMSNERPATTDPQIERSAFPSKALVGQRRNRVHLRRVIGRQPHTLR
ncbi:MAG TPA: hypothetical protein G4O08_08710 [Anaerolineae bacterium]|nr:hypothetical protein [Anaerolineae bacterium]